MIEYGNPVVAAAIVAVCSFALNLFILLAFRASDKKDRRLDVVKRMIEHFTAETERSGQTIRQETAESENRISKMTGEVNVLLEKVRSETTMLLGKVSSQLKEIQLYSDDMARLHDSMASYKRALDGLAKLTDEAQTKAAQVSQDAAALDGIRTEMAQFKTDMEESEKHLTSHEQRVVTLESGSLDNIKKAVDHTTEVVQEALVCINTERDKLKLTVRETTRSAADQVMDDVNSRYALISGDVERMVKLLDNKVKACVDANEILTVSGKETLDRICQRAGDLLIASQTVEELSDRRDELEKQIAELQQLKVVEEEHVETARGETRRLAEEARSLRVLNQYARHAEEQSPYMKYDKESPVNNNDNGAETTGVATQGEKPVFMVPPDSGSTNKA